MEPREGACRWQKMQIDEARGPEGTRKSDGHKDRGSSYRAFQSTSERLNFILKAIGSSRQGREVICVLEREVRGDLGRKWFKGGWMEG
jgi:hypothetical protein